MLVETPPANWRRRLAGRDANAVEVGIAEAEAYVRDHWEPLEPSFEHETIENGDNPARWTMPCAPSTKHRPDAVTSPTISACLTPMSRSNRTNTPMSANQVYKNIGERLPWRPCACSKASPRATFDITGWSSAEAGSPCDAFAVKVEDSSEVGWRWSTAATGACACARQSPWRTGASPTPISTARPTSCLRDEHIMFSD
jgi:hypothetical protein